MKQIKTTPIFRSRRRWVGGLPWLAAGIVVLGGVTAPKATRAGDNSLPDAAQILDKFVEATGGKAAYQKIHNRVTKGHHEFIEMGFKGKQVSYQAEPNKGRTELEVEVLGSVKQGTDGDLVWYVSGMTGPLVETGVARAAALGEAVFDREVRWREFYKKAECVGEEVIEGKSHYKVVLTPEAGEPETRYYDKESNLLAKTKKTRLSSHVPPASVEITVGDYKWVDGLLIAHERKQTTQGCGGRNEIVFVTDSIEHNVDMPSDRFDPPKEIRALANKLAAGTEGSASGPAPGKRGGGCGHGATTAGGNSGCGGGSASSKTTAGASATGGGGCGSTQAATASQEAATPQQQPGGCGGGS